MKILFTSFLLFIAYTSFSQSKELVILDTYSKKPIDLAQIFYPNLDVGSISNADGKVKIPLLESDIIISHVNYNSRKFTFNSFKQKDTLFLVHKRNQLEEVVIYDLDLKQKFEDIITNSYLKKYSTKKVIHNCTYKETFKVNDSLSRLFQVQLDWFSENSLFQIDKIMDKQNTIHLESVDYSKILELDDLLTTSKAAYVENELFFQFAHLNLLLDLLINLTEDYEIKSVQKNENTNTVYFNASLRQDGNVVYNHKNSLIVFDKDYKAIKQLKFNMEYETGFEVDVSKKNDIPYKKKTESHIMELSFNTLKNKKYSIGYYTSKLNGVIKTDKSTDKVISEQSLFVTESELGKKLKKETMDFYKPFYESMPNNLKTKDVKILLTKNEKDFLDTKE